MNCLLSSLASCKPGSSSSAGEACKLCPVSTFQPLFAAVGCHNCPKGYQTAETGALNKDMCKKEKKKEKDTKLTTTKKPAPPKTEHDRNKGKS